MVKADGLAAGKGVTVCDSREEAVTAVNQIMVSRSFGDAGNHILIEDRLYGTECSFIAITDGSTVKSLQQARDYKHQLDGNHGPMTGGMGAFAPAPLTPALAKKIMAEIVHPTLRQLRNNRIVYRGAIYFGLMLTSFGPMVLEINCRFGDPETQVILPLIKGVGPLPLLMAVAAGDGSLKNLPLSWHNEYAVGLTLAAPGYPGKPLVGKKITGLDTAAGAGIIFHAGTKQGPDFSWQTNGGRVVTVVCLGENQNQARLRAYAAADKINFDGGKQLRRDIAL